MAKVYIFNKPFVMINNPAIAKQIMLTKSKIFRNHTIPRNRVLSFNDEDGLFNLRDDSWLKRRKILQPVFRGESLGGILEHIKETANDLVKILKTKESVELVSEFKKYSIEVICKQSFNFQMHALEGQNADIMNSLNALLKPRGFLYGVVRGWARVPTAVNRSYRKHENVVKSLIQNFVEKAKTEETEDYHKTIIAKILESKYEDGSKLTISQLEAEGTVFLIAGTETTSTLLAWTFYALSKNLDIKKRLQTEIDSNSDKELILDSLEKDYPYLNAVIDEALRLYDPASSTNRVCDEDTEIDGVIIPKGTSILINIYGIHHDEKLYENPFKFDPERFLNTKDRDPFSFMPFGQGPRLCIGSKFALIEAKVAVILLMRNFEFVPQYDTSAEVEPIVGITLSPKSVLMKISPRK